MLHTHNISSQLQKMTVVANFGLTVVISYQIQNILLIYGQSPPE
jgi:hypothetical protein